MDLQMLSASVFCRNLRFENLFDMCYYYYFFYLSKKAKCTNAREVVMHEYVPVHR